MGNVKRRTTKSSQSKLIQLSRTIEGTVKSFDGTPIWYKSVGKGVPIVFCNGLGCSTFFFSYLIDYFKRNFQVVMWDYRGHGRSAPPSFKKNHTIKALTLDLKAVMNKLKIKKAILVGHSMGTQVLYEFYSKYPSRCVAIVSCFGTFGKPMDTLYDSPLSKYIFEIIYIFNHLFPRISNLIGTFILKNPLWFELGGALKLLKPFMADKKILRQYTNHITNVDPIFLTKLTLNLQEHTIEPIIKKLKIPTLIIAGKEDAFTPLWVSKKMHRIIPKSELFVVQKGTHVALVEQPELINLRIEKFLKEKVIKDRWKK